MMFFARQILSGKTLGRFLFNREIARHAFLLSGRVLDLASGDGSYRSLLPASIELVRTDLRSSDHIVDFNEPLLFPDRSFDAVLLFNALYIAEEPGKLMGEIHRILKPNGTALIASPFMQNEMREPHDYRRLTSEGLKNLFSEAGFSIKKIVPYGERFSVAANLLHSFWYFSVIRLCVYAFAHALDHLIPQRVRQNHPAPIGYFCLLKT